MSQDEQLKVEVPKNRYLQFNLGEENYVIPLLTVCEVIPVPSTTPLPNAPAYTRGIMNLRGQIVLVMDLRKKLNITPKQQGSEEAVVIVEIEGVSIGLIVDVIKRVYSISESKLVNMPEVTQQIHASYIKGVFRIDDEISVLLELGKILEIDEIKREMARKDAA